MQCAVLCGACNLCTIQTLFLYLGSILKACFYTAQDLNLGSYHLGSSLIIRYTGQFPVSINSR